MTYYTNQVAARFCLAQNVGFVESELDPIGGASGLDTVGEVESIIGVEDVDEWSPVFVESVVAANKKAPSSPIVGIKVQSQVPQAKVHSNKENSRSVSNDQGDTGSDDRSLAIDENETPQLGFDQKNNSKS